MHERFYDIIGRILSGTATMREKKELEQILATNPELQRLYGVLFTETVEERDHTEGMQAYAAHFAKMQLAGHFDDTKEASDPLEVRLQPRGKSLLFKSVLGMVAALILASSWFLLNTTSSEGPVFNNEVLTKKGSQTYVKLPDGTAVWLNAESKLSYPDEFDKSRREVKLTGEAYFEVTSNKDRPFIIHAGTTNIKVLGTAFNLRAYPDEKEVETTLIHGIVEVTLAQQPGNVIQMKAGEKLSVRNAEKITEGTDPVMGIDPAIDQKEPVLLLSKTQVHPTDSVALETVWRENRLAFDADGFGKMISKISKWYNVDIVVKDDDLFSTSFTAIFENKTLDQVLGALQYTGKFTYRIQDNIVYID